MKRADAWYTVCYASACFGIALLIIGVAMYVLEPIGQPWLAYGGLILVASTGVWLGFADATKGDAK